MTHRWTSIDSLYVYPFGRSTDSNEGTEPVVTEYNSDSESGTNSSSAVNVNVPTSPGAAKMKNSDKISEIYSRQVELYNTITLYIKLSLLYNCIAAFDGNVKQDVTDATTFLG